MGKLFVLKLLGALGLSATLTLAACGGGGGDSGAPTVQPTSQLMMMPNIAGGLRMTAGYSGVVAKISGGQKPYYAQTTGGAYPTLLDDGSLYVQALAPTTSTSCSDDSSDSGSSNANYIWIQDSSYCAAHGSVNGNCSALGGQSGSGGSSGTPSSTPWSVVIPVCVDPAPVYALWSTFGVSNTATIDLSAGESQSFTVFNGKAPYTTTNSNSSIATIVNNGGGAFTVTGGKAASTPDTIVIIDATGNTFTLTVNVTDSNSTPASALAVTPTTGSDVIGSTLSFVVSGGVTPYKVISSNAAVATASVSGSVISVHLLAAGNTTLLITDATNDAPVTAQVTVTASSASGGAMSTSPTSASGVVSNTLTFSVIGGVAPYTAVSSNQSVATASVNGAVVSVQLLTAGSATITIQDSQGAMTAPTVTATSAPPSSGNAFTVIPPSQTLAEGSTDSLTFMLANSTGPFYVTWPDWASGLITVSPSVFDKTQSEFYVTLVNGACVKSDKSIPITATDAANNTTATVMVTVQNTIPSNDGNAGCF